VPFALTVTDGVMKGRAYTAHVTGWSDALRSGSYDLALDGGTRARLRLSPDAGTAELKQYDPEDIGVALAPPFDLPAVQQSQVLRRDGTNDVQWRAAMRRRLTLLLMGGGAELLDLAVQEGRWVEGPAIASTDRDDNPDPSPGLYTVSEVSFVQTLRLPGPVTVERDMHGYLAVPSAPMPDGGYPAALVLNGHFGSAAAEFDPTNTLYGHGDAFARRGYMVLAIDIEHRPLADRADLYTDEFPIEHPAIAAPGTDTNWEEDGERTWDAIVAASWLRGLPEVHRSHMVVVGLSMGGEVATWTAALDPEIAAAVIAGFSPDFDVYAYSSNHPCWKWRHGDARDYVDDSDLLALIAPRPVVVETGEVDYTFSGFSPPFVEDREVLNRARSAWPDAGSLVHDLHNGGHELRFSELMAPVNDDVWDGTTAGTGETLFDWVARNLRQMRE
jgi:dienelactone hydrolase